MNTLDQNEISPSYIKDFRARNKLTQDDLAKKLGYSRSMIAQIEIGTHEMTPRIKKLIKYDIEEIENGAETGTN